MTKQNHKIVLEMRDINKAFPGVQALENVNLDLRDGEIHALLGENGAGKSTLIKILGGVYSADSGEIGIDGQIVKINNPVEASSIGIAIIHQELHIIPYLSVADNVLLGQHPINSLGLIKNQELISQTQGTLDKLGLTISPKILAYKLTPAAQQLVLISQALSRNPRFLVMDEPTSALGEADIDCLFDVIRALVKRNVAVIYISHKLDEIFELSDRVTVLRDGKNVGTRITKETDRNELINMMVGRKLTEMYPKKQVKISGPIFEVKDFWVEGASSPVNFTLKRGEILGIFGLLGSGRTKLFSAIFGASKGSGTILIDGQEVNIKTPADALHAGVGMLPLERKKEGLVQPMSVHNNLLLSNYPAYEKIGLMQDRMMKGNAEKWVDALKIRCTSGKQLTRFLSGGNQQKVVFGRLMEVNSKILILNSPTRGIDVGAKVEIYNLMGELCAQGKSVIFITSELPELLGLSDRILVMCDGRFTGEFSREKATQEDIMRAAVGEEIIACEA